jgi:hypothetical protein
MRVIPGSRIARYKVPECQIQAVVPAGDYWWFAGVPVLLEGPETVHAPCDMAEVGNRTKRTVLLPGSTREGTTEAGDGGDPTRSGSAGSRCLRTECPAGEKRGPETLSTSKRRTRPETQVRHCLPTNEKKK